MSLDMITTTLSDLAKANTPSSPGLPSPLGLLMCLKMPVRQSWKRLALFEAIEAELARRSKLEIEIFSRYSDKSGPEGLPIIEASNPQFVESSRELEDLGKLQTSLDHEPVKISDLSGDLSAHDLRILRNCGVVVE